LESGLAYWYACLKNVTKQSKSSLDGNMALAPAAFPPPFPPPYVRVLLDQLSAVVTAGGGKDYDVFPGGDKYDQGLAGFFRQSFRDGQKVVGIKIRVFPAQDSSDSVALHNFHRRLFDKGILQLVKLLSYFLVFFILSLYLVQQIAVVSGIFPVQLRNDAVLVR
jgi:hypothetical protein